MGVDGGLGNFGGRLLALGQRPVLAQRVVGAHERGGCEGGDQQRQDDLSEPLAGLAPNQEVPPKTKAQLSNSPLRPRVSTTSSL